jgi:hypothetical protein
VLAFDPGTSIEKHRDRHLKKSEITTHIIADNQEITKRASCIPKFSCSKMHNNITQQPNKFIQFQTIAETTENKGGFPCNGDSKDIVAGAVWPWLGDTA